MLCDFARINVFAAPIAASRGSPPGDKSLLAEIGQALVSRGWTRADPDTATTERFKDLPPAQSGKQ